MTARRSGLSRAFDVALISALWAGSIVAIGFFARIAVWLYCVGYGCEL
jgi:hypothetical protein